ncbi:MAG: cellulase family glycosylhydrolase [Kiritimatiellae bacterium]|nr:cellulase family glycosylhydrolase [Kiritimatiellia bacterium]
MKREARFMLGCNYFASHAGTQMWREWSERAVARDFAALARHGLDTVRVFPVWSDFQPLNAQYQKGLRDLRWGEEPLPDTPEGRAGVDPVMAQRLQTLLRLAQTSGLQVILELITGWMSGRNFRPALFHERNFYTDPLCLQWQVRLVDYLVNACKGSRAVTAWGLGNECNCIGDAGSRAAAWAWTALITKTIRLADPSRPVMSSMHGLGVADGSRYWHIKDQAEHTDILTIHPYPYYTPHCHRDRLTALRTILHAEAESSLYADIGARPCLSQEVGVLGPMIGSDRRSADYMRSVLWSVWSCNDLGCLWWMAFDTHHRFEPPYDWNPKECELGFMDEKRRPKPVLKAMARFREVLDSLPGKYRALPKKKTEVACILTHGQENWAVAYSAYVLAKQAGFDIRFVHPDDDPPEARFFMLPSLRSGTCYSRRLWQTLLARVERGADLYLGFSNAFIDCFKAITGLEIEERCVRTRPVQMLKAGKPVRSIPLPREPNNEPMKYVFTPAGAEILATEEDGNPLLSRFDVGRGRVTFLAASLETALAYESGAFEDRANDYAALYESIFSKAIAGRLVRKHSGLRELALSEHPAGRGRVVCVGINHGRTRLQDAVRLARRVKSVRVLHGVAARNGHELQVVLPPNDAFVLELEC